MEITKEYFDEQLSKLATKADLETQKEYFDDRMSTLRQDVADGRREIIALQEDVSEIRNTMATKDDLKEFRIEMNTKFDAMFELLDVRKKVEELQDQMAAVRRELKLA
jgi:predicted  nucleic acid-binding Zn-ribbon protein